MYANPSGSFTVGNSQRDPSDCTRDELLNLFYEEKARIKQQTYSISVLEAACAKERELRLQQSAVANEIDTLRAELSRTKLELEEERTRTAQLSRTVDTIQQSHQAQFRIDNTSFYTEQIAHLTHEIQDMTRQLKDERARSAQHMRTVSELEFTLNQERESNAQVNDSARMEIASLTFQVDELSRELSDERDRVAQNTRAISMLENDLACERTEREANLNNATDDLTHVRIELHRTRQLLESERSRCAQHVSTIQELENKMKKERDELSNGSGKSIKQIAELQGELQRVGLLLDQERDHTSQLTKSLATVEQELSKHRETWRSERQNFEQTIEQYKRGAADNQNAKNEFSQLKDELKEKDARIRTLEMEHSRITYELGVAHQAITDRRTKEEELARGLSDLQNKNSVLQQDFSTSERRVQDLTRRLEDVNTRYMELEQKSSKNTETHTVECRNLETKLQTSYSELSSLRAHLQQHLEKIAEQTHKINELELSLSAERSIKQTSEGRIQKEVESIERRAQESLIALSEERARVSVFERKISELEVAQIRLSAEAEEATNRLKRKTTECEEIEVRVRERDAALVGERDRVQELTRQIRSLEDAATAMRSDVERTQSELRQSREANSSVATDVTRLQSTLETERKRIVTLNTRITELESELRTESERRQLLDRSNKDVDGVRTKLENDLHDVQRVLAEERRKISDLQRSNSELMSAARNHQSELDRVKDHERVRISELEHKLTLAREECTTVHREREALRKELHQCNRMKFVESDGKSAKEIQLATALNIAETDLEWTKKALERERKRNAELANVLESVQKDRHQLVLQRSVSQASFRGSMSPRLSAQSIIENEIQQVGLMKEFGSVVASPTGSQKSTRTNHLEAIKIQESRKNVPIVSSANVVGDSDIVSNSKELSSFPVVDADVDGTFVDVDEAS